MNNYYVYVYLDPRKPGKYKYGEYEFDYEPFYIGKGKDNRFLRHLTEWVLENDSNKLKTNKIKKIMEKEEPIVFKIEKNLSHDDSCQVEKNLISMIGRVDLHNGPLTNLTDGGEGSFERKVSNSTKNKISNSKKGRIPWNKGLTAKTDERVKRYVDKRHIKYTPEILERMSKKAKKRCQNSEYKDNFVNLMKSEKVVEKRRLSRMNNKSSVGVKNGRFRKDVDDELLRKLYLEGNSFYKIQTITGVNNQTVKRHLMIMGVIQ